MFEIYNNRKVFITGHTGFKGSWLTAALEKVNALTAGYALEPYTNPAHFNLLNTSGNSTIGNILDAEKLTASIMSFQPEIIFHLAAQPLVRQSYVDPIGTYQTNIIGTLNLLEAARKCKSVKAIVLITTDKVYENKEWEKAYTESDELGGYDMYSSSKACCEILARSYRNSFFNINDYKTKHEVLLATVRAGNVIGGGDWSNDRLIPDIVKATAQQQKVQIRNPRAVRPWQHVLDCIQGYLLLGEKLLQEKAAFAAPWNFSPHSKETRTVEEIAAIAKTVWPEVAIEFGTPPANYHEANLLILDNSKAIEKLGWKPVWDTQEAVERTIAWYKDFYQNEQVQTGQDIVAYMQKLKMN